MRARQTVMDGIVAVVSSAIIILCGGCATVGQHQAVLIRDDDLQACKCAATNAFLNRVTSLRLDYTQPIVFRVDNWRKPIVTVYLPAREVYLPIEEDTHSRTYVYYNPN